MVFSKYRSPNFSLGKAGVQTLVWENIVGSNNAKILKLKLFNNRAIK
jgi:hypothetical protein